MRRFISGTSHAARYRHEPVGEVAYVAKPRLHLFSNGYTTSARGQVIVERHRLPAIYAVSGR